MAEDLELSDISDTLAQRGTQYKDNWELYVDLKACVRNMQTSSLNRKQEYCIDMILVKLSRILRGDPNKADNWHDLEGYAKLGKPSHVPSIAHPPIDPRL